MTERDHLKRTTHLLEYAAQEVQGLSDTIQSALGALADSSVSRKLHMYERIEAIFEADHLFASWTSADKDELRDLIVDTLAGDAKETPS